MEEYIKLLDLPDEFDLAILKKAYRKKVMKFHPDKAKDEAQRAEFEEIMKKLNAANDYLKEYLERHDGKYTKPAEEDIKEEFEEQTEEETEDYSSSENSDEPNSDEANSDEEQQEESIYEKENDDLGFSKLTPAAQILAVLTLMFHPKLLYQMLKNTNANPFAPVFGSLKNTILFIVLFSLLINPIYNFIDKYGYPDNNQPKQEIVQDNTTNQQSSETLPETNLEDDKPSTLEEIPGDTPKETPKETPEETAEINEYMRNFQRQIKRNWDLPKNIMAEKGYDEVKVVVNLTISKDGELLGEPQIKESSGLAIVDSRCLEAVKLTAPFNPLPKSISKDSLDVEFIFEANRR